MVAVAAASTAAAVGRLGIGGAGQAITAGLPACLTVGGIAADAADGYLIGISPIGPGAGGGKAVFDWPLRWSIIEIGHAQKKSHHEPKRNHAGNGKRVGRRHDFEIVPRGQEPATGRSADRRVQCG